jgi:hypothetical protein
MDTKFRLITIIILGMFPFGSAYATEQRYFNSYIVRAVQILKKNRDAKYNAAAYFTKDLDYGDQKAVIKAREPPFTMCNAAVTEVILQAINLYAAEHKGWSPRQVIPASSWTTARWSLLMPHMFSHDYMGYDPLEAINKAHIPIAPGLKKDIKNFDSEHGMSIALEKFGLGESIKFEDARPGDVISFDRQLDGGGAKPGHSAIFLAFLNRDQREVTRFRPGEVGFKYFSVQSSEPAGLGERWAYFKVPEGARKATEICPFSEGKKVPVDPKRSYCKDAVDSDENRSRFPSLMSGQPRDCCVQRSGEDGPRVGRVLAPKYWTYPAKQKQIERDEAALRDHVEEYMENLSRAGERLKLYAMGAMVLQQSNSRAAITYIQRVRDRFGIDLDLIARDPTTPEISKSSLRDISRITPVDVIRRANEQVTLAKKKELDERVRVSATTKVRQVHDRSDDGIPNPKFDGQSTD